MEMDQLLKIKEGSLVLVGDRWGHQTVKTVIRVTATRIILNGLREYNSYKRDSGYTYGQSWSTDSEHIIGFATKAALAKQEAEEKEAADAGNAKVRKQEQERDLCQALSSLFTGDACVQGYSKRDDRDQCYAIHGLTETQVRSIASFMKRQKKGVK